MQTSLSELQVCEGNRFSAPSMSTTSSNKENDVFEDEEEGGSHSSEQEAGHGGRARGLGATSVSSSQMVRLQNSEWMKARRSNSIRSASNGAGSSGSKGSRGSLRRIQLLRRLSESGTLRVTQLSDAITPSAYSTPDTSDKDLKQDKVVDLHSSSDGSGSLSSENSFSNSSSSRSGDSKNGGDSSCCGCHKMYNLQASVCRVSVSLYACACARLRPALMCAVGNGATRMATC